MKSLPIILALLILGCNNREQKEKEEIDRLEAKRQQEMKSGIRNDTIFLGYWFGMTEPEFNRKTIELKEQGKLYVNEDNYLAYKMTIDDGIIGEAEATYSPEYIAGKLFQLGVSVKSKNIYTPILTQLQLVQIYQKKYGFDYIRVKTILSTDDKEYDYYWIDGNRQIKILKGLDDARVFYTDITAENLAKENENAKQEKESAKTKADI